MKKNAYLFGMGGCLISALLITSLTKVDARHAQSLSCNCRRSHIPVRRSWRCLCRFRGRADGEWRSSGLCQRHRHNDRWAPSKQGRGGCRGGGGWSGGGCARSGCSRSGGDNRNSRPLSGGSGLGRLGRVNGSTEPAHGMHQRAPPGTRGQPWFAAAASPRAPAGAVGAAVALIVARRRTGAGTLRHRRGGSTTCLQR